MLDFDRAVKILLAYIAVSAGPKTADYCSRFVATYLEYPPEMPHETIVVCNGGPLPRDVALQFDTLRCSFLPRVNDPGWDISAYQHIAHNFDCDMLLCFGESVYFHRPGWLKKLVEAWEMHGPGMYGLFSSNLVRTHLNTTAFVTAARPLRNYPRPNNRADRYNFEHGEHAYWRYVKSLEMPVKLVTWDGVWDPIQWRAPRNILWRETQNNCLAFCSHTDHYFAANTKTKRRWERWIDQPFR